jgi:hypothetical protein
MPDAVKAGIIYSLLVFLVAAMLGSIRLTLLVPLFGPVTAVMIELPIILAISWRICGIILKNIPVAAVFGPRLVMGATALVCVLLEELALGTLAFGQSFSTFFGQYSTVPGLMGLAGQVVFALMPLVRRVAPQPAGG